MFNFCSPKPNTGKHFGLQSASLIHLETDETLKKDNLPELSVADYLFYGFIGLLCHVIYGILPGITRYLQLEVGIHPFQMLVVPSVINALLVGTYMLLVDGIGSLLTVKKILHILFFMTCNIYTLNLASRFTLSIYVQLLMLTSPLCIVLVTKFTFKSPLPKYTISAIFIAAVGTVIALFGDELISLVDSDHRGDYKLTGRDYIGFALALLYGLSVGVVSVWYQIQDMSHPVSCLVWMSYSSTMITAIPLSVALEDWTSLSDITPIGWVLWAVHGVGIWLVGNYAQAIAIRKLGSVVIGTTYPLRLVVALLFGTFILEEELNYINIFGSLVVFCAVGFYLIVQCLNNKELRDIDLLESSDDGDGEHLEISDSRLR